MSNIFYLKHFLKNNDQATDNKGLLAEVKFGNAVKQGDIDYALSYRNIEPNAVIGAYTTNTNYQDSKGFKVTANYKVRDNATLTVYQDLTDKVSDGASKKRTDVEFSVKF